MTFVRLFEDSDTSDWPYAWARPRGLEDAPARIGWLRRCYRGLTRMVIIRIHYGLDDEEDFQQEVVIPAVCLCQRLSWPCSLGVTAMDAERKAQAEEGGRHAEAIRRAIWRPVRAGLPGDAILAAAGAINRNFDHPMSNRELADVVRRLAATIVGGPRR